MKTLDKITKIKYTSLELELAPKVSDIIRSINLLPNNDPQFTRGAKFDELMTELQKRKLIYPDTQIMNLLTKLKNDAVLANIEKKWYYVVV
ncbi:MAG: hypothetical protein WC623_21715 [Pedobacter sp.]